MQPPVLEGRATYYAEPYIGREMRNGDTYTGEGMTCAVSNDLWEQLHGKQLLVCTQFENDCTQKPCIEVVVTDTGDAAEFAEHRVVVDLSPTAFRELVGPLGVGVAEVRVWAVPGH